MRLRNSLRNGLLAAVLAAAPLNSIGCSANSSCTGPGLYSPIEDWQSFSKSINEKNMTPYQKRFIKEFKAQDEAIRKEQMSYFQESPIINSKNPSDKDIVIFSHYCRLLYGEEGAFRQMHKKRK